VRRREGSRESAARSDLRWFNIGLARRHRTDRGLPAPLSTEARLRSREPALGRGSPDRGARPALKIDQGVHRAFYFRLTRVCGLGIFALWLGP
jgi:hypothetical protein